MWIDSFNVPTTQFRTSTLCQSGHVPAVWPGQCIPLSEDVRIEDTRGKHTFNPIIEPGWASGQQSFRTHFSTDSQPRPITPLIDQPFNPEVILPYNHPDYELVLRRRRDPVLAVGNSLTINDVNGMSRVSASTAWSPGSSSLERSSSSIPPTNSSVDTPASINKAVDMEPTHNGILLAPAVPVATTKCEHCSMMFTSRQNLRHHIGEQHARLCDIDNCQKLFKDRKALRQHKIEVHCSQKRYECVCGYRTPRRENFDRHKDKHICEPGRKIQITKRMKRS